MQTPIQWLRSYYLGVRAFKEYEKQQAEWWKEHWKLRRRQILALRAGQEIEPPWIVFPRSEPGSFNQGANEGWMDVIWYPFWRSLTKTRRVEYVDKWDAPPMWRDIMTNSWMNMETVPIDLDALPKLVDENSEGQGDSPG